MSVRNDRPVQQARPGPSPRTAERTARAPNAPKAGSGPSARAELNALIQNSPKSADDLTCREVRKWQVEDLLSRRIAPVAQMSVPQAKDASRLLKGVPEATAFLFKSFMYGLQADVQARADGLLGDAALKAAHADLTALHQKSGKANTALDAAKVERLLIRHFGPTEDLSPVQARQASELLDAVVQGRPSLVALQARLAEVALVRLARLQNLDEEQQFSRAKKLGKALRLASEDPNAMGNPKYGHLLTDQRFRQLLRNKGLQQALEAGDAGALVDRRVVELLHDDKHHGTLVRLGSCGESGWLR